MDDHPPGQATGAGQIYVVEALPAVRDAPVKPTTVVISVEANTVDQVARLLWSIPKLEESDRWEEPRATRSPK